MTALLDLIDIDQPAARAYGGKRSLIWTVHGPGELHRCRFDIAWVEVTEREPMRGEPLWLALSRRADLDQPRGPFTDACHTAAKAELMPLLARDFGTRWEAAHRPTVAGDWLDAADEARARARWFDRANELSELYAAGMVTLREPELDEYDRARAFVRPPEVTIVSGHQRTERVPRIADVWLDGEHVGHLTARGVVPVGGLT